MLNSEAFLRGPVRNEFGPPVCGGFSVPFRALGWGAALARVLGQPDMLDAPWVDR